MEKADKASSARNSLVSGAATALPLIHVVAAMAKPTTIRVIGVKKLGFMTASLRCSAVKALCADREVAAIGGWSGGL